MRKLVGTGSRRGKAPPSRAGDFLRRPLVWAAFAAAMAATGRRGRRAATRGMACSAIATMIHLPIKGLVGRRRPRRAGLAGLGPLTSSFPSGHTASDLGFTLGASQEIPGLIGPLALATLGSHWSLIRARKHYPSDVFAGGAIAFAVTAAAWWLRPPERVTRG
jgi:membrane-associated phospholipid phosphatase